MGASVEAFNTVLSIGTILAWIVIIALVWLRFFAEGALAPVQDFLREKGLWCASLVALIAAAGSLIYSDVVGFYVCVFCWVQRALMYPLVLIFGFAAYTKNHLVAKVGMALATLGALIGLYQYVMQMREAYGLSSALPCAAGSLAPSCSALYVFGFGFVTIPFMALTSFVLCLVLASFASKRA
jgi:disulfide bond formation protein DsbB